MEKFEKQPMLNDLLEQYNITFLSKQDITLEDLVEMKKKGISTEMFLDFLGQKNNYLFHGSRNDIPFAEQITSPSGNIFATDEPAIAILKALYLNNAKNLGYPMHLAKDKSNMKLVIDTPKENTIGERGYIYIISNSKDFKKDPNSNWQYLKQTGDDDGVSFVKKIQVEKSDFKYPVNIE